MPLPRVLALALLGAVASAAGCGDGGDRALPATAPASVDAAPDSPAGLVAPTFAVAGPSSVATCEVAAQSAPCSAPSASADGGAANALYVVYYPTDLGAAGAKHPIVTWGNGTDAAPGQYSVLLGHLASWGFVVVASTSPNTGTGAEMLAGEDYLVAADADARSPFQGHLDLDHIASVGHSQGADGAAQAFLAADAPGSTHRTITTLLPIELPAQEWTCYGSTDPSCPHAESFDSKSLAFGSVFFVDGSKDTVIAPPTQAAGTSGEQSVQAYYDATPARTPRAKGTLRGADHNDIQDHCSPGFGCAGVGPAGYLGYVTAWLLYELEGNFRARAVFAGAAPEIDRDSAWEYQDQSNLP